MHMGVRRLDGYAVGVMVMHAYGVSGGLENAVNKLIRGGGWVRIIVRVRVRIRVRVSGRIRVRVSGSFQVSVKLRARSLNVKLRVNVMTL